MRISDASRPQCRLVTPRAAPSARLIAYWVRRKAWKPSNTVSHASCVPLEGNGGAKRRSCRPDEGAYGMPSPCRIPSVRPPASDCRPQGGHPCIERTRDAHGRSNVLRPLQRRFKARKKPEGYTSTPTGLKRLKTAKYGVLHQRKRKGDAIRRPPTYTQAQTHSCKRRVRRFLFWWRRGESNPRPKAVPYQVSTVYLIESI